MKTFKAIIIYLTSVILFTTLSFVALPLQIARKIIRKESLHQYFFTLAISEDQRGGSYLYGTEDFTISSMTYYYSDIKQHKWAKIFKSFIDFFAIFFANQKEHCKRSYYNELREFKQKEKYER